MYVQVRLQWHDHPVTMMEKVELPDFRLIGWKTGHQRLQYPNGVWDRAEVKFTFARRYGFYLFQSYFPTSLTVISSWVGFFFDVRSVSARSYFTFQHTLTFFKIPLLYSPVTFRIYKHTFYTLKKLVQIIAFVRSARVHT